MSSTKKPLTNYIRYHDPRLRKDCVGHYDIVNETVELLSFKSRVPIDNLYQVIELGEANIVSGGDPYPIANVKILPPLAGRDVLCVGKNYAEHAKEFNSSGFDSSDKVDTPSHPVIFTKRFTSIIAHGEEIYLHPEFTQTLDYEGEIGVIIGKAGYRISEEDAMSHVWGYTIINDVTAREKQRDHKQFYIDMQTQAIQGPIAVPTSQLETTLRVQTRVNGELRQNATTQDLIFSIPYLIKTMSEGQTLVPGDVLATGTPAGVGIGRNPPVYLKAGDIVAVSVTGLATLENRVAEPGKGNPTLQKIQDISYLPPKHLNAKFDTSRLITINDKPLYYHRWGSDASTGAPIVFMHGLGGTTNFFGPLIQTLNLRLTHKLHVFDFEGHGQSPTSPLRAISIPSLAEDLNGIFEHACITSDATIIAHAMGCLIAVHFALSHPSKISRLILLGPPPSPLSKIESMIPRAHKQSTLENSLFKLANRSAAVGASEKIRSTNPLALTAMNLSLQAQDPEGYAKACRALADAEQLDFSAIQAKTLILVGSEDGLSTPKVCEEYATAMQGRARVEVLEDVGNWPIFEDCASVARAIDAFLKEE